MNFPHLIKSNIPHCQKCGKTKNLTKYLTTSSGRNLYFCNPCNSERCRKWRNKGDNMDKVVASVKRYVKKNPARLKAWWRIRDNHIEKKPCKVCKSAKVHAHHPDPARPFFIVHLCPLHHRQVHDKKILCPKGFDFSTKKA